MLEPAAIDSRTASTLPGAGLNRALTSRPASVARKVSGAMVAPYTMTIVTAVSAGASSVLAAAGAA